jgi:hypothetical protein
LGGGDQEVTGTDGYRDSANGKQQGAGEFHITV